jgi:AGZA family xanthine/uracil permease-like MFS transporter
MLSTAAAWFEFPKLKTNWRTEITAGATTFLTMAYIIFVNPAILKEAGVPVAAATIATCLSAAFGSILMGLIARYPIALAPGMGLNAYFTYAVVVGMGIPWQTALGAVFLSGVAFLLLTAVGLRQMILNALPTELYAAVAAGIGLFIAFIGLRNAGIVVGNAATLVGLGNLRTAGAALAILGLLVMAALQARGFPAAILTGILTTTIVAIVLGQAHPAASTEGISAIAQTAFQLDLKGALQIGLLEVVFVFLFVDLFDNLGTLVGVGKKAGLFDDANRIPRLDRIFVTDSLATMFGSLMGTSTVVSYIESASGVAAGGRSGVTAIVTGLLFIAAAFLAPFAGAIPPAATAPALILVGSLMVSHVAEINWRDPLVAIPAFLTLLCIPLTFSIANGLAIGFTTYAAMRLLTGRYKEVNPVVYVLAALFVARFVYLGKE